MIQSKQKKIEQYTKISEVRYYMAMAYQLDDKAQIKKLLERGLIEIDEHIRESYSDYWRNDNA